MILALTLFWTVVLADSASIQTQFVQVAPAAADASFLRSAHQTRVVLLIHGFGANNGTKPHLHSWQVGGKNAILVNTLAKEADVFAFAYGQNGTLEQIAESADLADNVRRLRDLGYKEIILVGHSAGGVLAREFVEDHPDAGVTKVIQICGPNTGCDAAKLVGGILGKSRKPFLESLTIRGRERRLKQRAGKKIPETVEFVCVVGRKPTEDEMETRDDTIVALESQWPEDLRKQGIAAVAINQIHFSSVRSKEGADTVARLIREKQPRWNVAQVKAAKLAILGEK